MCFFNGKYYQSYICILFLKLIAIINDHSLIFGKYITVTNEFLIRKQLLLYAVIAQHVFQLFSV